MGEVYRHLRIIGYVVAVICRFDRCSTVRLLQPQKRLEISRAGARNIGGGKKRRSSYCSRHLKSRTIHVSDIRNEGEVASKSERSGCDIKNKKVFPRFHC